MNAWIVFAKEPQAGQVKTRMSPAIDPESAARLYEAFVDDVCAAVEPVAGHDRKLLLSPGGGGPKLAAIARRHGFTTGAQEGDDLGARMKKAIGDALAGGAERVILVGSDSPTMPAESLRAARAALARYGAVLGPAGDGGYWLVGASGKVPDLFEGIAWSTRDVLAQTLSRAHEQRIDLLMLPFWYDVDDVHDLKLLAAHLDRLPPDVAPRTRKALRETRLP